MISRKKSQAEITASLLRSIDNRLSIISNQLNTQQLKEQDPQELEEFFKEAQELRSSRKVEYMVLSDIARHKYYLELSPAQIQRRIENGKSV